MDEVLTPLVPIDRVVLPVLPLGVVVGVLSEVTRYVRAVGVLIGGVLNLPAVHVLHVHLLLIHQSELLLIFFGFENLVPVKLCMVYFLDTVVCVGMMPNYGLQSAGVNSIALSNNSYIFVLALIFWNYHIGRRMVLFVTHEYV